jgi:hypothetical protein
MPPAQREATTGSALVRKDAAHMWAVKMRRAIRNSPTASATWAVGMLAA